MDICCTDDLGLSDPIEAVLLVCLCDLYGRGECGEDLARWRKTAWDQCLGTQQRDNSQFIYPVDERERGGIVLFLMRTGRIPELSH